MQPPGIFAKTFARPSVEEVFAAVARHGLGHVQFNLASAGLPTLPDSVDPGVLEAVRGAARRHGIQITAVSATFNLIHPDLAHRRDGLRRLGFVAATARALGCRLLTLCTGTRDTGDMWRAHPDNRTPGAWRDLRSSLEEALAIAEQHDVALGIEPELANVVDSAPRARQLLDEMKSPRLRVVLDAANLFSPAQAGRMRAVLEEAVGLLGPDLALVHAKELSPEGHPGHLPLGHGILDWDHYLRVVAATGFQGPVVMHGFEEKDVPASLAFLQARLAAVPETPP